MDMKSLFDVETCIGPFEVAGPDGKKYDLRFYFRKAKPEEELELNRRMSRQRIKENGQIESSDAALLAPGWSFKQLCTRITCENGNGEPAVDVPRDEWVDIDEQVKKDAWATFRTRVKKKDAQELSD